MKRIVKKFSDFSYLKEDIQNNGEVPSDIEAGAPSEEWNAQQVSDSGEIEESPLSQISEETGMSIDRDDKGEFIKTGEGDIIRYFSETGYYNETKKKKYGENISDVLSSIQSAPVSESKKHSPSCRKGCGCKTK